MKYLSVCSGIEAATVAWHPLGWEAVAYSEIEKFPSEVLAHHYSNTPNVGDMTKFKEWNFESNVDLLVGGTPCQSFSVAGLRKGLDDPRGNLMLTYLAIAKQYRPNWLVWENVPGVLSSNGGRDFGSFLGGLAECGYGFAYRVLDAQYFGVTQRRRRVFVVGHLGDWRSAAAVLFERHSLQGHPAPSREKRQSVAIYTPSSIGGYSEGVGTLRAHGGDIGGGSENLLTQPCYGIQGNMIGRADDAGPNGIGITADVSFTLTKGDQHAVAQPIAYNIAPGKGELKDDIHVTDADATKTLDASGSNPAMHQGGAAILQPIAFSGQMSNPQTDVNMTQTLQAKNPMAVCLMDQGGGVMSIENDMIGTLRRETHGHEPIVIQSVGTDLYNGAITGDVAVPMTNRADGTGTGPTVMQAMAVRRLTPVECERLQGFPDNYTNIKEKCPDGPRYKALGNSMAVPVMAWIGARIQQYEDMQ
jgi:DNA (cytosine-5)-methyltransferase 1